jgi:hypothetical protein
MSRRRIQFEGSLPCDPALLFEAMEELFPKVEFLSSEEARQFARKRNFKTVAQWRRWAKSRHRPSYIPHAPDIIYKDNGFAGWGDFLGTKIVNRKKRKFLSYSKAREFMKDKGLKNWNDWKEFCANGERPYNIPGNPLEYYKGKGWVSLWDFLGCDYLPFKEARVVIRSCNFNSQKQLCKFVNSDHYPSVIPKSPSIVYKGEYIDVHDWIGVKGKEPLTFEATRLLHRKLNLKDYEDWKLYINNGKRFHGFCKNPEDKFKQEWNNYYDWLGITPCKDKDIKNPVSCEKAKEFLKDLPVSNLRAWREYCKEGKKPHNMFRYPNTMYKNRGWKGWKYFLGGEFVSHKEAKHIIRKMNIKSTTEWYALCKENKIPKNVPKSPHNYYKNKGWTNWKDFLGTNK